MIYSLITRIPPALLLITAIVGWLILGLIIG